MNKTIQFNSDFLSTVSKKKSLNGTRKKEKPGLTSNNNSKVLRQKLLERIKDYQNKTTNSDQKNEASVIGASQPIDNTFNNSLEILKGLSSSIGHNKTVKHRPTASDVSIEMPDCFKEDKPATPISHPTFIPDTSKHNSEPAIETREGSKDKVITNDSDLPDIGIHETEPIKLVIKDQPAYSCIKNGSRPTYKEMKTSGIPTDTELPTQLNSLTESTPVLPDTMPLTIKDKKPQLPRRRMITKTYKYTLGKNGRNVSVLLKDMKTRKMVKKECSQLSHTPIHDIKQYLRRKNLLKIGSNATDDVVQKIYEQAVLTGEVRNMSKDTLIHNFMKT
jgi:hypothetical protein